LKILLTGADGFTGRPFALEAKSAGHEVVALQSDLTDRDALRQEVYEVAPDAVVHLAAIAFVGHAHEKAFYDVNVIGTVNLLDALVQLPHAPLKVLLASSANIYGNCQASPIVESQAPAPVNHYAMSKLAMEYMARNYASRLPIVLARPFNYTGPGQTENFVIPKLVGHFARRLPVVELGNMHVEREFNDVRMVCSAYLELLQIGESGEAYNICSGLVYSLQYVINMLTDLTSHMIQVKVNPAFVRAEELHRLCGSPAKLNALLAMHGKTLSSFLLNDTLRLMLAKSARNVV
jgi:GDP-6-deoxy-D-talose 4-dehydrogenase